MLLYINEDVRIATLEQEDKPDVLSLYSQTNFTNDNESGCLRPSIKQFNEILDLILSGDDENNILVLKKNGKLIGYASLFVEYSNLNIGHVAVKQEEQHKGYGKLLIESAVKLATNDDRNVVLFCDRNNSLFKKMGFDTKDNIHYSLKTFDKPKNNLPKIFVGVQEYSDRCKAKQEEQLKSFKNFLNSFEDKLL